MLPLSVLIPTRNCGALIPGHLQSLRPWMELAEEIVVVDSQSKDGTVELLRAGLDHPRVRFLDHPPGLYQSWNFGIQNTTARYIYISTVGDSITRAGVEHLLELAEKLQSDVVISKPRFINEAGGALPDSRWPIDEILDRLRIQSPRLLTGVEQFLFAVTNSWGAILGSSASNIYRAACLRERPFPLEYGTSGDGGWGIENVFDVKIAITPERFSTFRHHEKAYAASDYYVESLAFKLFRLAQKVVAQARGRNAEVPRILDATRWPELESALHISFTEQETLEKCRRGKIPWMLQPAAWQARRKRNQALGRIRALTEEILAARRAD